MLPGVPQEQDCDGHFCAWVLPSSPSPLCLPLSMAPVQGGGAASLSVSFFQLGEVPAQRRRRDGVEQMGGRKQALRCRAHPGKLITRLWF